MCTALIRDAVADVSVALAGTYEAERIKEGLLNALTIILRGELERALPVVSCLVGEKPESLLLPVALKDVEAELVELPDLADLPVLD